MLAEIYNTKEIAEARQVEFFNATKHLFKGTRYCNLIKHPTEDKWAVPCFSEGKLKVTNNGETLSDDWFPETDI